MLLWNGLLVLFVLLAGFPWNMARPQLHLLSLTVKRRISHCEPENLQYKMHPEFWSSHRQIFKTSLYHKTRLILETRRYSMLQHHTADTSLEEVRLSQAQSYHSKKKHKIISKIDNTVKPIYLQYYISCTLVGNKIVDHSDVVGASPVGTAPTTSSLST